MIFVRFLALFITIFLVFFGLLHDLHGLPRLVINIFRKALRKNGPTRAEIIYNA